MKIAVLLQCHKQAEQINGLLDSLRHPDVDVYIHVDRKSNVEKALRLHERMHLLPDAVRVDVQWGNISQVDATQNLMQYASNHGRYDFYWLISGQDVLLKPMGHIVELFAQDPLHAWISVSEGKLFSKRCQLYYPRWMIGRSILRRGIKKLYILATGGNCRTFRVFQRSGSPVAQFYFGSSWWALPGRDVLWMLEYMEAHPRYKEYLRNSVCPDECFFQTLYMLSPFEKKYRGCPCYVKWSGGRGGSPDILKMEDLPQLRASDKLIARKFDVSYDPQVISVLQEGI